MLLVAVAWIYVVLMMALAEAMSPRGTLLGALITFVLYGVLPLGIVLYLMSAPARRRLRAQREAASIEPGHGGEHAAGVVDAGAVAPERKEA